MDLVDFLESNNPEKLLPGMFDAVASFFKEYVYEYIVGAAPQIAIISQVFTVLFIAGLIFIVLKQRELSSKEYEVYKPIDMEDMAEQRHETEWDIIMIHLASGNPAEWKLAIIEADNMLDEVLKSAGYSGDTLGERLTAGAEGNKELFSPVWEAHKVRNKIAHEQGFELTKRETERALAAYETFLKKFGKDI